MFARYIPLYQKGYTLVEVMVAALILGLSITGVMSMVGTGRDIEFRSQLRREATIIASAAMEDTALHFSKYTSMATALPPPTTTVLYGGIPATCATTISAEISYPLMDYSGSVLVPYKTISVHVTWDVDGVSESIVLSKRVTQAK